MMIRIKSLTKCLVAGVVAVFLFAATPAFSEYCAIGGSHA
jgi:hypothetical protein